MDGLINWNAFAFKYDKREKEAFEQLCYLLFCAEFNNRKGLFRYKNQVGIETEPLEKDGKQYGFQSKYYQGSIDDNKSDIIDSIKKAKSKNSQLNEFFLYVNQELSESSNKDKKKPEYQLEIENAASKNGLVLRWRVKSQIEKQLLLPENKYIYNLFFNLNPNESDLIDELNKHNDSILQYVQTEILYGTNNIKIDRTPLIDNLTIEFHSNSNVIISGEGGCGKTAVFKEFYEKQKNNFPICVFKANELNVNRINDVFKLDHDYSLSLFIDAFKDEKLKLFVIDSAERLAEISNNEIINELLSTLIKNCWSILFISRYAYLNDLIFHIKETYQLSFKVIDIPLIDQDTLLSISQTNVFALPSNNVFVERLKNLFYLKEYVQHYSDIDRQGNYKSFINVIWKKRIQATDQKNNINLEREKCIIEIAKRRSASGMFYINADDLPQHALFKLKQDEIIIYDETHNGFFFAHDIYEEWALNRVISRCYANYIGAKDFFNQLGNSLPIRRAYRMWMSDQLIENCDEIENYINEILSCVEIPQFWKDELLISILLSDYSDSFFKSYEKEIEANNNELLLRMLFLLNIACTDISSDNNFDFYKPKGNGWNSVISFMFNKGDVFFQTNLKPILPILNKWCDFNKNGNTTKYAGLMAFDFIKKIEENEERPYIDAKVEKELFHVVFNSSSELQTELKIIFEKVITNKWFQHKDPYYNLCSEILMKPYLAANLIKVLPDSVIKLCYFFWKKQSEEDEVHRYSMECRYGLVDEFKFHYFPSSANQTPTWWLLQFEPRKAIDFIINFTNDAVESYSKSDYGTQDVEEITLHIDKAEVKQHISNAVWCMYRGNASPVVPHVLQSMHMALEKYLLKISNILSKEEINGLLKKILLQSKSASLTSVVCSVVLAAPDKLYETALILFKTIDLFHYDTFRCSNEFEAKSLYSLCAGLDVFKTKIYVEERLKTCEDKHRSLCLESIFLQYQLIGVKGFSAEQNSEIISTLYNIIDTNKANLLINEEHGLLLARMDRRNLIPNVTPRDDNSFVVEFTPKEISDKQKIEVENANKLYDAAFKYSSLRIWSDFLSNVSKTNDPNYIKFDNNPLLALQEVKQLIKEIEAGQRNRVMMEHVIPAYTCSKLLIYHIGKLSKDDIAFCKEIVLSTIAQLFSDDYDYQIADGVEASVCAIPPLIIEYPEEANDLIMILVLALLDDFQFGSGKRICDYVIESIFITSLWGLHQEIAKKILFGYIKIYPIYHRIYANLRKRQGFWGKVSKNNLLSELDKDLSDFDFDNCLVRESDVESLNINAIEIIYQLIPSDTKEKQHCCIISKTLPIILPILLNEDNKQSSVICDSGKQYLIRHYLQKRIAYFLLQRETDELDVFLNSIIELLVLSKETASFIEELISAEDVLNHPKEFWYIWWKLYPKIKSLCENSYSYYKDDVITNYLLAWNWWKEDVKGWHSLSKENLSFYNNVSNEMGNYPSVLYSISKVLNSVGSSFDNEGIEWIFSIVSTNKALNLDKLESNTMYYLEVFIRKYLYSNKQRIKKEVLLKNKIITILDFMIERSSVHAYLLRESII